MQIKPRSIPFKVGRPIQDPANFFGRTEALQAISNAMFNLQNVSLHGERRTGKTSLLLYLAHPSSSSNLGLPDNHVPVYFDFQDFANATSGTIWLAIAEAIAEKLKQRHPEAKVEADKFLSAVSKLVSSSDAPELFGTGFGRALGHLDDAGFIIHLLFDEFDQTVRNLKLGDFFYDTLRGLPTRAENISYVIATRTGLATLQPTYRKVSSPFFNIFTSFTLGPFQEEDVCRLIFHYFSRAQRDTPLAQKLCADLDFLYEVTGYHPFFLQTFCYHLYASLDKSDWPSGEARDCAMRAFDEDSKSHFNFYWKVSSKEEQDLLKRLATTQVIDWDQSENTTVARSLRDRCLLVEELQGDRKWRVFSTAFSDWIKVPRQTRAEIGKFKIVETVGEGRMGVVYKAHDPMIERDVAIKVITERALDLPEIKERFHREARSAGKLSHPNIIVVHEVSEVDGNPYIVMEYLEGTPLGEMIKVKRAISLTDKIKIAIQICRGLQYAHSNRIIHRDIRPKNIQILQDGIVKIRDFGIAKLEAGTLTQTGIMVGTLAYMSPEQIKGIKVDTRSDIFSFGVLFYELLTYKRPFLGDDTSIMYKIVHEEPEKIELQETDLVEILQQILSKCLEKDPEDRYHSCAEIVADLKEVISFKGIQRTIGELLDQGKTLCQQKRPEAVEKFEEVLNLDPENKEAKRLKEECLENIDNVKTILVDKPRLKPAKQTPGKGVHIPQPSLRKGGRKGVFALTVALLLLASGTFVFREQIKGLLQNDSLLAQLNDVQEEIRQVKSQADGNNARSLAVEAYDFATNKEEEGKNLLAMKKYSQAIEAFQNATRGYETAVSEKGAVEKALELFQQGDYTEGLKALEAVFGNTPYNGENKMARELYTDIQRAQFNFEQKIKDAKFAYNRGDLTSAFAFLNALPERYQEMLEVRNLRETIIAKDQAAPVIQHTAERKYDPRKSIKISATVQDNLELSTVNLHYAKKGDKLFAQGRMVAEKKGVYAFMIPPRYHRGTEIRYYFVAIDINNNQQNLATQKKPYKIKTAMKSNVPQIP